MITDLRIHGEIGADKEFFATIRGEGVGHAYFHETVEQGSALKHRFFFAGSEFLLGPEGFFHRGNGGSFCPYMFGVEEPIEDLIKPDVINRLVLFGAVEDKESSRKIRFTNETAGHETYREIFLRGHAVYNYFFFVHFPSGEPLRQQQERILRNLGKHLKRYPLSLEVDDAKIANLFWSLGEKKATLFLLRLVNLFHLEFYRAFEDVYSRTRYLRDEDQAVLRDLAQSKNIDFYSQERMKIDILSRHPENRQVVAEYRSALVDIWRRKHMDLDDRARLTRLRTVALRRDIPVNLLDSLDEKLLPEKESLQGKEPEYLVEARAVLETFFLKRREVRVHLEKEDLIRILHAKMSALTNRDMSFDSMLIEVGRQCDEMGSQQNDPGILEEFGSIVTYLDRFDAVYHDINYLAFHEAQNLGEDRLRSLLRNKKLFEEISVGLFRELFVEPILRNPYLPQYGRAKVETLSDGIDCIEAGDLSLQDVVSTLTRLVTEERDHHVAKTVIGNWLRKTGRDLGKDEEEAFLRQAGRQLAARGLVAAETPETIYRRALEELKTERLYLSTVLPQIVRTKNVQMRKDFISSSGMDLMRLEELEREFLQRYHIDESVLGEIREAAT